MGRTVAPPRVGAASLRQLAPLVVSVLLAAIALACTGAAEDSAGDERAAELEATVHSLEASLEALAAENAELRSEIETLRREQANLAEALEAAEAAADQEEDTADSESGQAEQLAALEEAQTRIAERLDGLDTRIRELEEVASRVESVFPSAKEWTEGKDEQSALPEGSASERTVRLVEESGGSSSYVDHPDRGERSVLVTPREFVDGETPLIVSLHGYGGDSADQIAYVPLHERVNTHGFALLLPNGTVDGEGNRFWNPTDHCCDGGKSGEDDVAYLTELVAGAREAWDFGPVYFFGYSNGGFMAYHMACKALPGLRAVASLAGTSYVEDSSCDGAPPVSVLHIHGSEDGVIRFEGDESARVPTGARAPAFYAGAREMVERWSQRAGCDWPGDSQPSAVLDLDQYVPGSETRVFRLEAGCAEGITIELWVGAGSSHAPGYGDAFVDALLAWLLSQE